jgi:MFS family permease
MNSSLTPSGLKKAMNLNITLGIGGALWFTLCSPQAIFNIFYKNHLGATSGQLGILLGLLQLTAVFNIFSIWLYGSIDRKKPAWIAFQTVHRAFGLVLAYVAYRASQAGTFPAGIRIIFITMPVSWILMNASASGWWSWIADLFPEKIRARFFGRRSSVISGFNIVWFFLSTVLLDVSRNSSMIFGTIFLVAAVFGILDVILHIFMPEPTKEERPKLRAATFMQPLKDRNFMTFCISIGVMLLSINVFAPFSAPYLTDPAKVGVPNTWIGIMFVLSQMTWLAVIPSWGLVMDRYGRKPAVIIGALFTVSWIGYFFVTSANYMYLLPVIALLAGLLAPAFWEGVSQMMLTLTPEKDRIGYVSWYLTITGVVSAAGSYAGGLLFDVFEPVQIEVSKNLTLGNFHIVLAISLALIGVSVAILTRTHEGDRKPVGFVMSALSRPGIFRTFMNVNILSGVSKSSRIAKVLRSVDGPEHHIASEDIVMRLDDPDQEVREEAARALGRMGSHEGVEALLANLKDPASTIRPLAARALGAIGAREALPYLIEGLSSPSEELQDACVRALGSFEPDESMHHLLKLFREERSERVMASGAEAVSRLGTLEAAWEILPRLHGTSNPVLRRQLAISMGNLLGSPGVFYRYVTGDPSKHAEQAGRLFQEARRSVTAIRRRGAEVRPDPKTMRSLKLSREAYLDEDYAGSLRHLLSFGIGNAEARLLEIPTEIPDGIAMLVDRLDGLIDAGLKKNTKLGIWIWLMAEAAKRLDALPTDTARVDTLLILYYLSTNKGARAATEA